MQLSTKAILEQLVSVSGVGTVYSGATLLSVHMQDYDSASPGNNVGLLLDTVSLRESVKFEQWLSTRAGLVALALMPTVVGIAAPSVDANPVKRKLIKQEPKFDTSLEPKRFELKIKRTQILMPEDPEVLLHGDQKIVRLSNDVRKDHLQASADSEKLKAHVEDRPKNYVMEGGAKEDKLQGQASNASSNPHTATVRTDVLKGRVADTALETTVSTIEHGVRPRFFVDLHKIVPKFAPDISRTLDAEMSAARKRSSDDVENRKKLMELELSKLPARPAMPGYKPANVDNPTAALQAELAQSRKKAGEVSRDSVSQLKSEIAQAEEAEKKRKKDLADELISSITSALFPKRPPQGPPSVPDPSNGASAPALATLPEIPGPKPAAPKLPPTPLQFPPVKIDVHFKMGTPPPQTKTTASISIPSKPADTTAAEAEMKRLQSKVNAASSQLNAELMQAKNRERQAVSRAQPAMDVVLTSLRKVPPTAIPSTDASVADAEVDAARLINWDAWHAKFAALAQKPILSALNKAGNPSGSNTVEITVTRDHHVSARVVQAGGEPFDSAISQAYQSLDGNVELTYPPGSRRSSLTFLIDNKHAGGGVPKNVQSQTSVGDKESVH